MSHPFPSSSHSPSLSFSLSLSCHVCRSVNRSSSFVHLFLCERERGSGLHSSKGFSYSLSAHIHTRTRASRASRQGAFTSPRHIVCCLAECCDFRLGEPDREEGFYPGSFRDLQQHAPAKPDFIPRLSWAQPQQQATREEWIVERAGRGTEGSLDAFPSSEDALCFTGGRLRVRWTHLRCSGWFLRAVGEGMYVYFTKLSCCILNLKIHLNWPCIYTLHRVCMHLCITF